MRISDWSSDVCSSDLRCRPDFLPSSVLRGAAVRAVSDLKFMAPEYCSPHGFSNAIRRFGYHLAAAFYYEGIEAIYGHRPTHWTHIVVRSEEHTSELQSLMRISYAVFCLKKKNHQYT